MLKARYGSNRAAGTAAEVRELYDHGAEILKSLLDSASYSKILDDYHQLCRRLVIENGKWLEAYTYMNHY